MHTPSITLREGGRNTAGEEEPTFTACSSSSFGYFRVVPAFCLGVVAAVAFQLAWGGLTLTSFFLKLFIYASFALMCVLAGSFVLLIRKSPLKVSHFEGGRRLTAGKHDFINKLMVSFLYFFLLYSHTHAKYTHMPFLQRWRLKLRTSCVRMMVLKTTTLQITVSMYGTDMKDCQ